MDVFYSRELPGYTAQLHYVGLGDLVARALSLVHIHPWPGCKCDERQAILNRFVLPVVVYCPVPPVIVSIEIPHEESGVNHHESVALDA